MEDELLEDRIYQFFWFQIHITVKTSLGLYRASPTTWNMFPPCGCKEQSTQILKMMCYAEAKTCCDESAWFVHPLRAYAPLEKPSNCIATEYLEVT